MQHWLDRLVDITAIHGDETTFKNALADLAQQAGFNAFAYLHVQPGHTVAVSNYHPEWRSVYFRRKYSAIDPVVNRAKSLKRVFAWSGDREKTRLTEAERAFYSHAAEYGIRCGITIPVKAAYGSISMFTLASDKPEIALNHDIDPVAAAAAVGQLHARMTFLPLMPGIQDPAWLDPKEAAYLQWIAVGKTMEEVADIEGVKYNTVKSKLEETRKRLDVHTMPHLVALAIRAGLI
ncbi:LuxR family transcriptional activator of conjugal transfer of Ti plasmids [Agrobacterium larrymoorei]|uniref:LuxR family transcriptional activator of conjugal transfer of Ti plasmids n=1 Tax=Agrobacterium larrymoorei TaxID=160699 RepID=A0AAJ2ERH9_9HYPH|nr:transcriptional regulator TraR [Agrobacterium larrymoorei]MDR6101829.1 LuxR family transcriptional activator of conjugal transfer of Ti plasmids [Agrobacterium larrymoorei]